MKLIPLIADRWKMDGGVAFGVVPKSLWNRNGMADENNMIPIVTRCLLISTGNRLILVDAGMGHKRNERYYEVRFRDPGTSLLKSLQEAGFSADEVTDLLFTHLHDDHVGGATFSGENHTVTEVFPNAHYHCSRTQWEWALNPNKREGASYFEDNLIPLQESGKLHLIETAGEWLPGIELAVFNGHTTGQIIPLISYRGRTIVFSGDFIPTQYNIPTAYVPSVDVRPLLTMQEKATYLQRAVKENHVMLFEHDHFNECCTFTETGKGIQAADCFAFSSLD